MRVVLTEESHNHVDWELKSSVVWIELGILVGAAVACLVVATSPSGLRWAVAGGVAAVAAASMAVFALTTPLVERGHLERLPDGGDLKRTRVWLIRGEHLSLDLEVGALVGIETETQAFEDVAPVIYRQARLWAVTADGVRHGLTPWAEPDSVDALAPALRRAARLDVSI